MAIKKLKGDAQRKADLATAIAEMAWKSAAFDAIVQALLAGEEEELLSVLKGNDPTTDFGDELAYTLHRMSEVSRDASLPLAPQPTRAKGW